MTTIKSTVSNNCRKKYSNKLKWLAIGMFTDRLYSDTFIPALTLHIWCQNIYRVIILFFFWCCKLLQLPNCRVPCGSNGFFFSPSLPPFCFVFHFIVTNFTLKSNFTSEVLSTYRAAAVVDVNTHLKESAPHIFPLKGTFFTIYSKEIFYSFFYIQQF